MSEHDQLRRKLAFQTEWYGTRWARLRELLRGTGLEGPACAIMANGTADWTEAPQQYVPAPHGAHPDALPHTKEETNE